MQLLLLLLLFTSFPKKTFRQLTSEFLSLLALFLCFFLFVCILQKSFCRYLQHSDGFCLFLGNLKHVLAVICVISMLFYYFRAACKAVVVAKSIFPIFFHMSKQLADQLLWHLAEQFVLIFASFQWFFTIPGQLANQSLLLFASFPWFLLFPCNLQCSLCCYKKNSHGFRIFLGNLQISFCSYLLHSHGFFLFLASCKAVLVAICLIPMAFSHL